MRKRVKVAARSLLLLLTAVSPCTGGQAQPQSISFDGKARLGLVTLRVDDQCALLTVAFYDSFLKGLKYRVRSGVPEFTNSGQPITHFPDEINIRILGDVSRCKNGNWSGVHERGFGTDLMQSLQ